MKRFTTVLLVGLMAAAFLFAGRSTALAAKSQPNVVFEDSKNPDMAEFKEALQESKMFEEALGVITSEMKLPEDIGVLVTDCGEVNAYYNPADKTITICYELFQHFAESFKDDVQTDEELGVAILQTTLFVFYHELGHGLIDVLDLPITGKEEDAVDQFSTLLLTFDDDEEESAALKGAIWFYNSGSDEYGDEDYADEHSLSQQRFYNITCWIYGSNPDKYTYLIESEYLPADRAALCQDEYSRMYKAWDALLTPYSN